MKKIFFLIVFLLPFLSEAATLRLDPATTAVSPGDVFVVNIRVDVSPDECVNASNVSLKYPTNLLRLNTLSRGESIFTLWVDEEIKHDIGEVRFTSGIPGGYCGRTAGDPGNTNIVGKIAFQYLGDGAGTDFNIDFAGDTEVILNDGFGTKAGLTTIGTKLSPKITGITRNEWLDIVKQDTFAPESFTPIIIQDETSPDKPYILIFDTLDKQSGVEHYEVIEEDPRSFGFRFGSKIKAKLSIAKSPYILMDQSLSSRIVVRAFDHAGNMQEEILPPKHMAPIFNPYRYEDYVLPSIIIIIGLIIMGAKILRNKKKNSLLREDKESNE